MAAALQAAELVIIVVSVVVDGGDGVGADVTASVAVACILVRCGAVRTGPASRRFISLTVRRVALPTRTFRCCRRRRRTVRSRIISLRCITITTNSSSSRSSYQVTSVVFPPRARSLLHIVGVNPFILFSMTRHYPISVNNRLYNTLYTVSIKSKPIVF